MDFVRALKSSNGPEQSDKIAIARNAWDDLHLQLPNKGEVIVDWILARFTKEKIQTSVVDIAYWTLLADILSPAQAPARPIKTWLGPLLNRISIAPVFISLLDLFPQLSASSRSLLSAQVCRCLGVIWPMASNKMNTDVLLDCFGAILACFPRLSGDDNMRQVGHSVVMSFIASLVNANNKKKVYLTFLKTHFEHWIPAVTGSPSSPGVGQLVKTIYAAGIEIIFNVDTLRHAQHDSQHDSPLFEALKARLLAASESASVPEALPLLFESYLQAIRKHRHTLFAQGSSQASNYSEEISATGMQFFASCQSLLEATPSNPAIWSSRARLLALVSQERIFRASDADMRSFMRRIGDIAIAALESAWKVNQALVDEMAVETLSALILIDYEIVAPALPVILPKLLLVQCPTILDRGTKSHPTFAFLDLLLQYHVKTRSMHVYIGDVLAAVSATAITVLPEDVQKSYRTLSSSPLLHPIHLDKLAKATHSFLTSGQVESTVRAALLLLENSWTSFLIAEETKPPASSQANARKKRNVDATSTRETSGDVDITAISMTLAMQLAAVVLSSLPLQFVPIAQRQDIRMLLVATQATFTHEVLKKTGKVIKKRGTDASWSQQIIAAAATRFQYALAARGYVSPPSEKATNRRLEFIADDHLLPELHLETYRALLWQCGVEGLPQHNVLIDHLLTYLETHRNPIATWSGLACRLTFGAKAKCETALALLHLVLERCLPVIDRLASTSQLDRFVKVCMSFSVADAMSAPNASFTPSVCVAQGMRSALFWEQPNLRSSFLAYISSSTSALDKVEVAAILTRSVARKPFKKLDLSADDVHRCITTYTALLSVPVEYLSRTTRAELVKRAVVADVLVQVLSSQDQEKVCSALLILRLFIRRVFSLIGFADSSAYRFSDLLKHLMKPRTPLGDSSVQSLTLDLVKTCIITLAKDTSSSFSEIVHFFATKDDGNNETLHAHGLQSLIDIITSDFALEQFTPEVQSAIKNLHTELVSTLLPQMTGVPSGSGNQKSRTPMNRADLYNTWSRTLSLRRWLSLTVSQSSLFGQDLIATIASPPGANNQTLVWKDTITAVFSILLEELNLRPEAEHDFHLEFIVAAYVAIRRSPQDISLDAYCAKFSKNLSIRDFAYVLDLASDLLFRMPATSVSILGLAGVFLRDSPQGTLKVTQNYVTGCLNIFVQQDIFITGPSPLRLGVLEFVARHCSDRAAALRSNDLATIWSLVSKFLHGSETHDSTTSTAVFHNIITIISSLIRLRRDLVTLALPHLGSILRQLVLLIRSSREHLGGKQRKLVGETFPTWINIDAKPLGPTEAKALARLLVTITTKTMIRSNASTVEVQRAESLAKPFSKHSVYVLKAYVDAINDPLCVVTSDVRREIYPGLFALCDMLSEHSRDAMMASSLDVGGKTALKSLWKEYEKQRYIGKG